MARRTWWSHSQYICLYTHVSEGVDKVILYSDGCTAQNRNAILSSGLSKLSQEIQITIEQKYLEKGHTQMECYSMHSTIERKLKKKIINVPADYVEVCELARLHPRPYVVEYLDYSFFLNFEPMQIINSIRPGRSSNDPAVTDIRGLRYNDDGSINVQTPPFRRMVTTTMSL
nr:unnamed protein product [Callosobruchus chinensis]